MTEDKYVGMDIHQASTVIAVHNRAGKTVMEAIIETKTEAIRDFFQGLSGRVHVTFEEGTQAQWLVQVIGPLVHELIVCDPRRNKLVQTGNKADRVDAQKLARLLRLGEVRRVYHGQGRQRQLKELVHSYDCLIRDATRLMNRIKAMYRSWGIGCRGLSVYQPKNRDQWLAKLPEASTRQRAQWLYQQLDGVQQLRRQARQQMLTHARRDPAYRWLRQVPGLGPIRVAQILAIGGTPHRFRTKRQWWSYVGLAVVTRTTDEYQLIQGRVQRKQKLAQTRGLNRHFNRRLKAVFKGAALVAIGHQPFKDYYQGLLAKGTRAELARLTVARKLAAITLAVWKTGDAFDPEKIIPTETAPGS